MSDLITRTARLVPYTRRPKHIASFVTAYAYEPAADEPSAHLGNLYVVVEVLVSGRASEEVVDLVIQSAGDMYYNEQGGESDALARFEAAIKQTNHELSEYVGRGNAAWIGKLSAIIAVQAGSELHVAQTGSAEAFLYRGKTVSRISQSDTPRPTTPSKTFGSIATGELDVGDKLLLATPALIHQIPLTKLQQVITNTGPNGAIQEISQLLVGAITNRIAAIVAETTTPELAALKVRSNEPEEIELGNGENFAEAALSAAAPIAHTTVQNSRKVAKAAAGRWQRIRPALRTTTLVGIAHLRKSLSTSKSRRISAAAVIISLVLIGMIGWHSAIQRSNKAKFSTYQQLFTRYVAARDTAATDKLNAREQLVGVQRSLDGLNSSQASINTSLKKNPLIVGEPTSVSAFKLLVASQIDQIDGLITITPTTVGEIGDKNGRPTFFESDGTRGYIINTNPRAITIISLQTGDQKSSSVDLVKLGDVTSTTLSAANDGMFILTSKPSVWFYKFSSDSISEQTLAYGTWPKAHAIASYGPNIYLLGDNIVYKHFKNATGYSPKTDYISTTPTMGTPSAIAVDGYVYVASQTGLSRYLSAEVRSTNPTPSSLGEITNLRSVAGGNLLIGTSSSSSRIGVWNGAGDKLFFDKQIALTSGKRLTDATYDQKLGKIFATIDNRLVSFPFKP